MAEGGSNETSAGESWESWLGGWVQTAKEKSQTALEFVKKDLAEFGTTVQKETEKAVEMTKGSLNSESTTDATKRVKAGLTSFLDNISKVLVIPHDDDDYVPMKVAADGSGLYDRGKARLHALQLDASTYIDPPHGPPEQYSMWLESFSLDEHKGEISELLVSKVEVRALYTKLVPSEVSNADFWQRYFYRVHQLQCDEARKQALMMRADQAGKKESVSWDDDEDEESDNDSNHSDWEKMPRPPQSYAAQQKAAEAQEKVASTKAVGQVLPGSEVPKNVDQAAQQQEQKTNQESPSVSSSVKEGPTQDEQIDDSGSSSSGKQMETSVSTSPGDQTSPDSADGSADSSQWSPVEVVSNPWSLHIPEDVANTSDAVETSKAQDFTTESLVNSGDGSLAEGEKAQQEDAVVEAAESTVASAETTVTVADAVVTAADKVYEAAEARLKEQPVSPPGPLEQTSVPDSRSSTQTSQQEPGTPPASDSACTSFVESTPEDVKSEVALSTPHGETGEVEGSEASASKSDTTEKKFVPLKDTEVGSDKPASDKTEKGVDNSDLASDQAGADKEIGMRVKGDMVVVGDRDSPSSTESTDLAKDLGLDEDWEQDFDVEITEEDLKAAESIAKRLGENLDDNDDDWENWE